MYDGDGRDSLEDGAEAELIERLKHDESGKLRDECIDELRVAATDIEAALADGVDAGQETLLRELLEVVRLSEIVLTEVWESFRG